MGDHNYMRKLFLLTLISVVVVMAQPNTPPGSLFLGAPPPMGLLPNQIGASVSGTPQNKQYFYWVVVRYGIGNAAPSGPVSVGNANFTLSSTNKVVVSWSSVSGATGYDLLRTTSRITPSGACACAVTTATTAITASDISNTLSAYTVASVGNGSAVIQLDNTITSGPIPEISINGGTFMPLLYGTTASYVSSFNTRTGAVTLLSSDVTGSFSGTCNGSTVLYGNGSCAAVSAGGSPGGSGTELQYRSGASTFGGMSGTSWDDTSRTFELDHPTLGAVLTFSADPLGYALSLNTSQIAAPNDSNGDGGPILAFAYSGSTNSAGNGGWGGQVQFTGGNGGGGGGGNNGGRGGDVIFTPGSHGSGGTPERDGLISWVSPISGSIGWILPAIASYNLTVPSAQGAGALTNDGSGNLSWTSVSLSGTTGSIGGGLLAAGACASGTVAVTGSTTSMTVTVSPNTYPGDGTDFSGYVSTNGTVTVKVCALVAVTPTSSTYNVRVIQ